MRRVATARELREIVAAWKRAGERVAFVPTMGNLHAGHLALVAIAREHAPRVVSSVFVNPTQFGPNEDFSRYPRTLEADAAQLADAKCDLLFAPGVEEMYPGGAAGHVRVEVPALDGFLEGAFRPGHFSGVATVVAKLFGLVQPDVAVFGQKDYQQLLVVRRLVADLAMPIAIVAGATRREPDGLAMSSRNQYLSAADRPRAAAIHATLRAVAGRVRAGEAPSDVEAWAQAQLREAGFVPDYVSVRD
ncbi:MAG TPA: pantoate--beta-alanine ligase, partial [Xanthomonadales bacterium]|nr:pantoate--beta-alanine ligase [Xanthomonadales bacterium]